jgi:response regulator RpfG family c-di-GMP phosphodiesterase
MKVKQVIIIDDDKLSNMVSVMMLRRISEAITVTSFTNPVLGFEAVKNLETANITPGSILLLLDLNMPEMTGWEFLDLFKDLDAKVRSAYHIVILSSSVDNRDINQARQNSLIKEFISKPLKTDLIKHLFD